MEKPPEHLAEVEANPQRHLDSASRPAGPVPPGTGYTCPMHSEIHEGNPGTCPKCGMALEPETPLLAEARVEYTCPMHPEILRDGPGACPKCGMALEPRTISAEENNEELIDMTRRFRVSATLSLPLFMLAMMADLAPSWLPAGLTMRSVQWLQFALATPVVLWGGWPFFVRGWRSLQTMNLNMFTLIGLGVGVAWTYSVAALLLPQRFPEVMRMEGGTVPVYFEAAAVITALVLLGQVLELRARSSTNAAIKLLLGLAPNTARLVRDDGSEADVGLNDVKPGDMLRVRPGDKVPVDGIVTDGRSTLDESIVRGAEEKGLVLAGTEAFESVTGQGVTGIVEGRKVALGTSKFLASMGIAPGGLDTRAEMGRAQGQTVMFIAVDGRAAGLIGVSDPIKETTPEAIRALHAEGLTVVMLTGDSATTAGAVARALGIDRIEAEVLPDRKAEIVKRLQAEGHRVAMAGDGINDAPALAQADVGIAMGTGTDVAMESAGVTLVKGDLRGIVRARRLSRAVMRNIRQNLFFAFVYNALGVPVAAGVLYPAFGLLLSPMIAAAAMSFSSVSVVANALRLRSAHAAKGAP